MLKHPCCPLPETTLLGPEAESLVFQFASGMELGAPQGVERVLAAWCNTWSLLHTPNQEGAEGTWVVLQTGPKEQRLSPTSLTRPREPTSA